jgi:hypothetical protein
MLGSDMRTTSLTGILSLGVLADDHPVEITWSGPSDTGGDSRKNGGWADVDVLLEDLSQGENQLPE